MNEYIPAASDSPADVEDKLNNLLEVASDQAEQLELHFNETDDQVSKKMKEDFEDCKSKLKASESKSKKLLDASNKMASRLKDINEKEVETRNNDSETKKVEAKERLMKEKKDEAEAKKDEAEAKQQAAQLKKDEAQLQLDLKNVIVVKENAESLLQQRTKEAEIADSKAESARNTRVDNENKLKLEVAKRDNSLYFK